MLVATIYLIAFIPFNALSSQGDRHFGRMCAMSVSAASINQCPRHYHHVADKCLRFVGERVDWNTARLRCTADGAQLISVHSEEENERLLCEWRGMFGRHSQTI